MIPLGEEHMDPLDQCFPTLKTFRLIYFNPKITGDPSRDLKHEDLDK